MKVERRMLLLGLFAAILGFKAYLIMRFGSDLPFWDQWAREGEMMIAPWREGTWRMSALFVPHSEHRIVPTLALNLALTNLGGRWDARVECVVNAVIHAAIIVLLTAFVVRQYSLRAGLAVGWMQLALGLAALDWENTLVGFQSQFYFLTGFSLVAIWGLLDRRGWHSGRWWCGLAAGGLAMISMGSGLLCFAAVGVVAAVEAASPPLVSPAGDAASPDTLFRRGLPPQRRQQSRQAEGTPLLRRTSLATIAVCAAALLTGWLTRGLAPWEDPNHAHSLRDFLLYAEHCLAWPSPVWPALAALAWLPWVYFAVRKLPTLTPRQELLLGVGIWVLLQIAAVSRYRGAGGGYPAYRYADIFTIGVLVNILAWFEFPLGRAGRFALGAWLVVITGGAVVGGRAIWRDTLPATAASYRGYEQTVKAYLRTGDAADLNPPHLAPFPYVDWLKRVLDRPSVRAVLPASVHAPGKTNPALSVICRDFCRTGIWLFAAGILLLLSAGALTCRRTE